MILWCIQCSKIIIIRFNLTSLKYLKAHSSKNIDQLVAHQCYRMKIADLCRLSRNGEVDPLSLISVLKLQLFHLFFHIGETVKGPCLQLVDRLAIACPLLRCKLPHFLHQFTDLTLLAFQIKIFKFI